MGKCYPHREKKNRQQKLAVEEPDIRFDKQRPQSSCNMLKKKQKLKKTTLKRSMMTSYQLRNINNEIKIIKRTKYKLWS